MTNREAYEEAAGMALDPMFFILNNVDPDAEFEDCHADKENDWSECPKIEDNEPEKPWSNEENPW